MKQDEILEKLRMVIGEVSGKDISSTTPEANLIEVLGLDSLGGLRMLATIEKRLEVRFPDEELSKLTSLAALAGAIQESSQGGT
jgi:acyl carrier protein